MAELGIVGKSPGKYAIYLGGNASSTRLGKLYKQMVKVDEMADTLRPIVMSFKDERENGEDFGDFCTRVVWPELEETE
mgnify:CR=1 FL=1